MTKAEQVLKQIADIESLRGEAIQEILGQRKALDDQLKTLGYEDGLRKRPQGGRRTIDPTKPCTICKFITDPAHDSRKHRGQGDKKRPFTPKELEEHHMVKLAASAAKS
jgi:hypothetical protein